MTKPSVGAKKSSQRRYWWSRNWFYTAIIVIAVIGAFCAFYLPLHISEQFSAGDNVASLRQAILVATWRYYRDAYSLGNPTQKSARKR